MPTLQEISADIEQAASLFESMRGSDQRVLWVAGGSAAHRSGIVMGVADKIRVPFLDIGKTLSAALLDVSPSLRAVSVEDCFYDLLDAGDGDSRCLDHLDILFEETLLLDAVNLIQASSRRYRIVASWPGHIDGDKLFYAPSEHPSHVEFQPAKFGGNFYLVS
jgi:hypothetical protein